MSSYRVEVTIEAPEGVNPVMLVRDVLALGRKWLSECREDPIWAVAHPAIFQDGRTWQQIIEAIKFNTVPADPASAAAERDNLLEEIKGVLVFCPTVIPCREGGGPENPVGTMALSVARLRHDYDVLLKRVGPPQSGGGHG